MRYRAIVMGATAHALYRKRFIGFLVIVSPAAVTCCEKVATPVAAAVVLPDELGCVTAL